MYNILNFLTSMKLKIVIYFPEMKYEDNVYINEAENFWQLKKKKVSRPNTYVSCRRYESHV